MMVNFIVAVGWAKPTDRANARVDLAAHHLFASDMVGTAQRAPLPTLRPEEMSRSVPGVQ